MTEWEIAAFFQQHQEALPLYERLQQAISSQIHPVQIQVQKTQISFYHRHLFACVSFARIRRKKDCPPVFLVLTLGLQRRLDSPRVEVAAEPYPHRWTHHFLISDESEIDEELMNWIREAAVLAELK